MGILTVGIAALVTSVAVGTACIKNQRDDFNSRINDTCFKQYEKQQAYYEYCKKLNNRIKNL